MGFYLRKAFGFGPFRLNLSRSGLGVSFGVKGARIGVGPRGSYTRGPGRDLLPPEPEPRCAPSEGLTARANVGGSIRSRERRGKRARGQLGRRPSQGIESLAKPSSSIAYCCCTGSAWIASSDGDLWVQRVRSPVRESVCCCPGVLRWNRRSAICSPQRCNEWYRRHVF